MSTDTATPRPALTTLSEEEVAFRDAVAIDPRETGVPSTKGTL